MGKNTGAAAADALAKILGVYLTTSAKEKDRAIDERRWQAQFELDKKRSEVEMQRAIREQAAYDRAQAEDKDINGILSSLKSQGITPPSGIDTRHELTSWLNIQNDLQDAADKKAREARDAEEFPFRKKLLEAQANAANNRGSGKTGGKPKSLRDWIPDFMLPEYDMVDNELRATDKEFELEKARLASLDDADSEGKKAIENKLKSLEEKRVGLGQRLGEMGFAVVKGGVDSPEKWDAYNKKLEEDYKQSQDDSLESAMMKKQAATPTTPTDTQTPDSSGDSGFWDTLARAVKRKEFEGRTQFNALKAAEMGLLKDYSTHAQWQGVIESQLRDHPDLKWTNYNYKDFLKFKDSSKLPTDQAFVRYTKGKLASLEEGQPGWMRMSSGEALNDTLPLDLMGAASLARSGVKYGITKALGKKVASSGPRWEPNFDAPDFGGQSAVEDFFRLPGPARQHALPAPGAVAPPNVITVPPRFGQTAGYSVPETPVSDSAYGFFDRLNTALKSAPRRAPLALPEPPPQGSVIPMPAPSAPGYELFPPYVGPNQPANLEYLRPYFETLRTR